MQNSFKRREEIKVIELYQEGLSYREIAKLVRISVRDISIIINDFTGEGRKSMSEKSVRSKAFQMFKDKKSLVDVLIELDLPASEVENIENMYSDYLKLDHREIITLFHNEIKDCFPDFLKYYKIVKTTNDPQRNKIRSIIDNDYIISKQERRQHELDLENERSLEFKIKLDIEIQKMRQDYEFFMNHNTNYNTR